MIEQIQYAIETTDCKIILRIVHYYIAHSNKYNWINTVIQSISLYYWCGNIFLCNYSTSLQNNFNIKDNN